MALVVYDQGVRIQTPVNSTLPLRTVEAMTESARSREMTTTDNRQQTQEPPSHPRISQEAQTYSNRAKQAYQTTERLNRRSDDSRQRPSVVSQIMTSPVFTIPVGASVAAALEQFRIHHVRHLAVMDANNRCHGVISEYDLLKRSSSLSQAGPTRADLTIEGTYSKQLIAATPDTSIQQVAVTFLKRRLTSMPVISEAGQLLGIVTHTDLVHMVANEAARERWI